MEIRARHSLQKHLMDGGLSIVVITLEHDNHPRESIYPKCTQRRKRRNLWFPSTRQRVINNQTIKIQSRFHCLLPAFWMVRNVLSHSIFENGIGNIVVGVGNIVVGDERILVSRCFSPPTECPIRCTHMSGNIDPF